MESFSGIFPAVVTPFDEAGRFWPEAFESLLNRLYEAGVHGVYVLGTTGEGMHQPVSQRKEVAELAVRTSPAGKQVIIHVGASTAEEAIDLARHAAFVGADAVSSLPPGGAGSFEEIKSYYERLAVSVDVPLLLYYFPEISPGIRTIDQLLTLCGIPNVAGLKFTDFDLYRLSQVRDAGYTVLNGRDEVLAAGLLMGANGGIGSFYNLMPELFVELYELGRAERWAEARMVQKQINQLIRVTLRYPVFPAIKAMLAWSGIDCGQCLDHISPLTESQARQLKDDLSSLEWEGSPMVELAAR